jgi:urease accessory protein UreE
MNFLRNFFSTDPDEEMKKQICDSITQEGRELAIKMLRKPVVHHQDINENLTTMEIFLIY